jgi:hypothetical protein
MGVYSHTIQVAPAAAAEIQDRDRLPREAPAQPLLKLRISLVRLRNQQRPAYARGRIRGGS